jgi:hypothetical protein
MARSYPEMGRYEHNSIALAGYAQITQPSNRHLAIFMTLRRQLAVMQRRTLNGQHCEENSTDNTYGGLSAAVDQRAPVAPDCDNKRKELFDPTINPFAYFKAWTEFEQDKPEPPTPLGAEEALRRNVVHYEANFIGCLGILLQLSLGSSSAMISS